MPVVSVSSKGQLVIPAPIRKTLGILPGSRLDVRLSADGAKIVLEPIPDPIKGLYGYLSGPSMTEALLDEREEERRREQEKCARLVRDDGIPEKGGILRDAR